MESRLFLATLLIASCPALSQSTTDGTYKLALLDHKGQLSWSADGFRVIQSSAKPGGREIGIRGKEGSGRLSFLGFLFLFPDEAPLTSAKCRDGIIGPEKKSNATMKVLETSELTKEGRLPISLVTYQKQGLDHKTNFSVRGFVATGDICGDLEFYSDAPISLADPDLRKTFSSLKLDKNYVPLFEDVLFYGEVLYRTHMYKAAAPVLESALQTVKAVPSADAKTMRRVVTDHAGMAYGMSGNIDKARKLFENAIKEDPNYPLYYYNLACADAEEKNLSDAKKHLQEAFDRKANVIVGEIMPNPMEDGSFLPYRNNKEFWSFLENLHQR